MKWSSSIDLVEVKENPPTHKHVHAHTHAHGHTNAHPHTYPLAQSRRSAKGIYLWPLDSGWGERLEFYSLYAPPGFPSHALVFDGLLGAPSGCPDQSACSQGEGRETAALSQIEVKENRTRPVHNAPLSSAHCSETFKDAAAFGDSSSSACGLEACQSLAQPSLALAPSTQSAQPCHCHPSVPTQCPVPALAHIMHSFHVNGSSLHICRGRPLQAGTVSNLPLDFPNVHSQNILSGRLNECLL